MDKGEAASIADLQLAQLRAETYSNLVDRLLGQVEVVEVTAESGVTYQLEVQGFWDSGEPGDLRVMIAVDNGGLRAFVSPVCRDFIVSSDGSFVGE
jgi:hypothetical protein